MHHADHNDNISGFLQEVDILLCERWAQPAYLTDPGKQMEIQTALVNSYLLFNSEQFDPTKLASLRLFMFSRKFSFNSDSV